MNLFEHYLLKTREELAEKISLLQQGGYILYVRHGEATFGKDQYNVDFQNCFTQRNLSEKGQQQAILYGYILHSLNIPISRVIASPFCRTIESAAFAFGSDMVEVDPFFFHIFQLQNGGLLEEKKVLEQLNLYLETPPEDGTNTIIFAHSFPKGIGLGQIPEMGSVMIHPNGKDVGYDLISTFSLTQLLKIFLGCSS